jgi:predicted AAA+ superfamily ATPase
MLVGPRQSGKTTILKQLDAQLRSGGRNTLWLNLDVEDDFRHLASQGALIQKIRLELGSGLYTGHWDFITQSQPLRLR